MFPSIPGNGSHFPLSHTYSQGVGRVALLTGTQSNSTFALWLVCSHRIDIAFLSLKIRGFGVRTAWNSQNFEDEGGMAGGGTGIGYIEPTAHVSYHRIAPALFEQAIELAHPSAVPVANGDIRGRILNTLKEHAAKCLVFHGWNPGKIEGEKVANISAL